MASEVAFRGTVAGLRQKQTKPPLWLASDNLLDEVILWSPRAVRLGLSSGLLVEIDGDVTFSPSFITALCLEGRDRADSEDPAAPQQSDEFV